MLLLLLLLLLILKGRINEATHKGGDSTPYSVGGDRKCITEYI